MSAVADRLRRTLEVTDPLRFGSNGHRPRAAAAIRQPQTDGREHRILSLTTADKAEAIAVDWWWTNYIPAGKFGLLDGDPGLGKSLITTGLVASATSGRPLPDGSLPTRVGGAVIFAAEDGYEDTILPRLQAAGADLSRVLVAHAADHGEPLELPRDIGLVAALMRRMEAVIAIFDPFERYLGADIIKGREQRLALEPVIKCFAELDAVLLGTRHLNQQSGQRALYRGRGDITGIGVSRYGFIVGPDPKSQDPKDRVFVPHKVNLVDQDRVRALRYRVDERDLGVDALGRPLAAAVVTWNGVTDVSADQALGSDSAKPQNTEDLIAQEILPRLESGPLLASVAWELMADFGVKSRDGITRARKKLGIVSTKKGDFTDSAWWWHLPGQVIPDDLVAARDFEGRE
jgi:hypothetical protein